MRTLTSIMLAAAFIAGCSKSITGTWKDDSGAVILIAEDGTVSYEHGTDKFSEACRKQGREDELKKCGKGRWQPPSKDDKSRVFLTLVDLDYTSTTGQSEASIVGCQCGKESEFSAWVNDDKLTLYREEPMKYLRFARAK
jgi:hypothetical protein